MRSTLIAALVRPFGLVLLGAGGCGAAPGAPAAPTEVVIPAPAAAPATAPRSADAEAAPAAAPEPVAEVDDAAPAPEAPPAPVFVPGPCAGELLQLQTVVKACACATAAFGRPLPGACPEGPRPEDAIRSGLHAVVEPASPKVRAGEKVELALRFRNDTARPMPLLLDREWTPEVVVTAPDGAELAPLPNGSCQELASSVSLLEAAAVVLPPQGELVARAVWVAKRERLDKDCMGSAPTGPALAKGVYGVQLSTPVYLGTSPMYPRVKVQIEVQ